VPRSASSGTCTRTGNVLRKGQRAIAAGEEADGRNDPPKTTSWLPLTRLMTATDSLKQRVERHAVAGASTPERGGLACVMVSEPAADGRPPS